MPGFLDIFSFRKKRQIEEAVKNIETYCRTLPPHLNKLYEGLETLKEVAPKQYRKVIQSEAYRGLVEKVEGLRQE